jgi:hypothetical protein
MIDEDLKPLCEYYCKNTPAQRIVLMKVDYREKSATLFYKGAGDVEIQTFDWCKENLVLLNEFNR